jgi:hypothetical protein
VTDARAETYLRLRAEAELRRALTLPRYDAAEAPGLPEPVRVAAELLGPAASVVARAAAPLQPVASRAAESLQPLGAEAAEAARALRPGADQAQRRLRPAAAEAWRRWQLLAGEADRRLQSLAAEAERRVRPLADQAAYRVQPLAWQAAARLHLLRAELEHNLPPWSLRAASGLGGLGRRVVSSPLPGRPERSAEDGLQRLGRVADALVLAGVIDDAVADSILESLELALLARSRLSPHLLLIWRARTRQQAAPPAGTYRAVPVGLTMPADPPAGPAETRLLTLVIAPDRAVLTATGRMPGPAAWPGRRHGPWPMYSEPGYPGGTGTDDRGNRYQLDLSSWRAGDGEWSGELELTPLPAAGIGWLELTTSNRSIRVALADPLAQASRASGRAPGDSPVARLLDAAAERLLYCAADTPASAEGYSLAGIADIVTALAATGALPAAQDAVDRLVTLAGRLGVAVPPTLTAAASRSSGPSRFRPGEGAELPARWLSVLEHRRRRDGRTGAAAAAAVLPELDGRRFVIAGLASTAVTAELTVLGWGRSPRSRPGIGHHTEEPFSWWVRDDTGGWHVGAEGDGGSGDGYSHMQLRLCPPLPAGVTSLEMILTGPSGQVSATVPLNWLTPASPTGRPRA